MKTFGFLVILGSIQGAQGSSPAQQTAEITYTPWDANQVDEVVESIPEGQFRGRFLKEALLLVPPSDPTHTYGSMWVPPTGSPTLSKGRPPGSSRWPRVDPRVGEVAAFRTLLGSLLRPDLVPSDLERYAFVCNYVHDPQRSSALTHPWRVLCAAYRVKYSHGAEWECSLNASAPQGSIEVIHGFVGGWKPSEMRTPEQVLQAVQDVLGPGKYEMKPPMPAEKIHDIARKSGLDKTLEDIKADYPRTYCFSAPERNLWIRAGRTILRDEQTGKEREVGAVNFRWFKVNPLTSKPAQ